MKKHWLLLPTLLLLLLPILSACNKGQTQESAAERGKNELRYADHLKIWCDSIARYAEVYNAADTVNPFVVYVFPKEGTYGDYQNIANSVVITTPCDNLLVYTSVHASALEELEASSVVGSVVDAAYFKSPTIVEGIKSGKVIDMGSSSAPVKEKLIAHKPTLAVVSLYDGMDVSMLQQLDIPLLYMADNLESTPLGRAEWIKLLGLLTGKSAQADSIFSEVEKNYLSLEKLASQTKKHPTVMAENMYQGIWYVAGGNSYAAKLIADAGGDYIWRDNKDNGSLSLSFESVLDKAAEADIWLMKVYGMELNADNLKQMDERYTLFRPYKTKSIWYCNTETSNLFEEFPFHPDRLLKDYIKIFHPDLLSDYNTAYYKPMQ